MKFTTPPAYHLVIGISFPDEVDNYRQTEQTKTILNELEEILKNELGKTNCVKKEKKKSLHINYFLARENSYKGAKKEIKETFKKLWKILKRMEKKHHITFHTYIFNELSEFFEDPLVSLL